MFLVIVQGCTTFELGLIAIGTHKPPCVEMEEFLKIFVDFDGFYNNFFVVRQPNC